jgi:hypothetical protein
MTLLVTPSDGIWSKKNGGPKQVMIFVEVDRVYLHKNH